MHQALTKSAGLIRYSHSHRVFAFKFLIYRILTDKTKVLNLLKSSCTVERRLSGMDSTVLSFQLYMLLLSFFMGCYGILMIIQSNLHQSPPPHIGHIFSPRRTIHKFALILTSLLGHLSTTQQPLKNVPTAKITSLQPASQSITDEMYYELLYIVLLYRKSSRTVIRTARRWSLFD